MMNFIVEHLVHLHALGRSPRTIGERRIVLRNAHEAMPNGLLRVTTADVERWLSGWSGWTLCTYHAHLRGFYGWAATGRSPWIDWNPMAEMPRPAVPHRLPWPVTDDELRRALAGSDRQWRLVILLAAYAGLRACEIGRLARDDVSEQHLRVHGKGNTVATVDTHPLVWDAVRDLAPGPLVRRPSGHPGSGRWLSTIARAHFDQLGQPEVRLHRFRAWYGTTVQVLQGDLLVTARAMRHRSPRAALGYLLVADARVRDAILSLPDVTAR